jgi:hypothetical protein
MVWPPESEVCQLRGAVTCVGSAALAQSLPGNHDIIHNMVQSLHEPTEWRRDQRLGVTLCPPESLLVSVVQRTADAHRTPRNMAENPVYSWVNQASLILHSDLFWVHCLKIWKTKSIWVRVSSWIRINSSRQLSVWLRGLVGCGVGLCNYMSSNWISG